MICVNIHIKAQIFIIKNKYLLFYINKFVVKSFSSTNNKDGEIFLTKWMKRLTKILKIETKIISLHLLILYLIF